MPVAHIAPDLSSNAPHGQHSPFDGIAQSRPVAHYSSSQPMEFSPMSDFGHSEPSSFSGHTLDNMGFSDAQYAPPSLLFRSPTDDNMTSPGSYMSPFPSLDDPLGTPMHLRHPQIQIDTTGYTSHSSSQTTLDGMVSPYEPLGMGSRRPSLATPSTSSSHLATPEHSPGESSQAHGYLKPNASPISPSTSLTDMFEQQAISLPSEFNPPGRPRQASRTVTELARELLLPSDGELVPQKTYRPHTQSDRRRYVEEVELEEPIMFFLQNSQRCGISLQDALNGRFMNLAGRDDHMFVNRGPSVSIRLMWPGYAPWSRQIPTRDFRTPPQPITRAKLAKNVAKTIQRFIQDMEQRPMEEDARPEWRVGSAHIQLHHLTLVGLQHVSMGSWQAYVAI
ncbi:uncharacterized protein B0H18DRAFT_982896 [Fomitopsis serialis]|uniref:uncharacterized protein n=1 Tax=Fomitopsis serialis TaxID=139415 RepID=UPI002007EE69|nr:uncharacterized protein B0H18DRAFT_982896 [Neoantrodia serialis]KAH9933290.1 hypothetical protein B0H18DRAFT_982896 [Neoantrodia serialis]